MKKQQGYTLVEVLIVAFVLLGIGGWIANIIKIAGSDFVSISGMLVLRIIGIFITPLGAVLGFI